jgi:hypothetical protein
MESLKSFHDRLKNLQSQGKKLIEARLALNARFVEEEVRLEREDEVSILQGVRRSVVEQLQRLREVEASASCGHSQASAVLFVVELAATAIASQGNRTSAIKDYLLRKATNKKEPFGLVMVCIGPKGLSDDARVVSISQLARKSGRPEPEIMNKQQCDGYLLFSQEAFSSLVDKLMNDVREGKLRLPVPRDKLAEIVGLNKPKSVIKIVPIE